ncbi:DUF4199 domain-containing protein [Oleiharenicola lentus]|uniref:DUF4199 domain-containing protein n=1 Tax=Oleiharenicola lentus TaxID=2508720 RepID=UPI003F679AEE
MSREFNFGLITGAAVCVWILLQYAFGLHTSHLAIGRYAGLLSNLIPVIALFLVLRARQRDTWDGRLTFARGIFSGLQVMFVSSLIVYCFLSIYHHYINPSWIDHALEWKVAQLRAGGSDEVAIRQHILAYREAYTPIGLVKSTVISMTLTGGVLAVLITLLMHILPKPAAKGTP